MVSGKGGAGTSGPLYTNQVAGKSAVTNPASVSVRFVIALLITLCVAFARSLFVKTQKFNITHFCLFLLKLFFL